MSTKRVCGKCGAELTGVGAEQLCPGCLLEGGLERAQESPQASAGGIATVRLDPGHERRESGPSGMTVPQHFGDYELLEEIARGGMGIVYKARQVSLDRIVALKMLLVGPLARPEFVQRFRTEAAAAASLQHPNIVAIHEVGFREGQHFFAMDYVAGRSLAEILRDGPLPARRAAAYVKTIAEAIQYAHKQGVLHRDLKPSNVLIDEHDQPKVTDFGLAKRLEKDTELTLSGQVLGSPNYMPPEQAAAHRGLVGKRSDVYSLGAILYHLLTGRAPFVASTLAETLVQVQTAQPVSPTVLNPHLPRDLKTICLKCLEKEPARRYPTAQEFADDLGRWLRQEPILARPVSRLEKVWRWCRRKPLVASLSFAVSALLLVVLIGSPIAVWRINRARELAEVKELEAWRTAYASDMNLIQQALALDNLGRAQELLSRHRPQFGVPASPGSVRSTNQSEILPPRGTESEIDRRGWEWRYLWQRCQSDALYTLCQKSNSIFSLAVSHDGRWLAVGEHAQGGLSLWDLRTRQEVAQLSAGEGTVVVTFSPREPLLAFTCSTEDKPGDWKHCVRLWDGAIRGIVGQLELSGPCRGLAFADDGQTLVTSTSPPRVSSTGLGADSLTLWRVHEGQQLASYPANQAGHNRGSPFAAARDLSIAVHPMSEARRIRAVDLTTGLEKWTAVAVGEDAYALIALAMSPDGRILASAGGYIDEPIRLWDVATGKGIRHLEGHRACIYCMVFWPDGKTLAAASLDQTIRLWDLTDTQSARPRATLRGHRLEAWCLALLPDQTTLVSGCKDGSVSLWDTSTIRRERALVTLPEPALVWRFAPDGKSVFTLNGQGHTVQWKGLDFQERELLMDIGSDFSTAAISPNAEWLATASETGTVSVWNLPRRAPARQFGTLPGRVHFVGFLAEGKRLATHDDLGFLREWDLTTGLQTRSWEVGRRTPATGLSDDGRWYVMIDRDRMTLTDLTAGHRSVANLDAKDVAGKIAFSADGRYFAAASQYGLAKVWGIASSREVARIHGVLGGFHSVAFSPDGKRLATGSGGKEAIKLWDLASNQELLTLEGRGSLFGRAAPIAFSPDGSVLGSVNGNGILHLWRAPSWAEIAQQEETAQP